MPSSFDLVEAVPAHAFEIGNRSTRHPPKPLGSLGWNRCHPSETPVNRGFPGYPIYIVLSLLGTGTTQAILEA